MFEYVIAFIMLCLVLYLAYFSTKWLGKQMQFKQNSRYMQVVDKLYVDRDKVILIVKFQESYKVIAMSSNAITDLGEIDNLDETNAYTEEQKINFSELYAKYRNIQKLKKQKQDGSDVSDGINE